jgi:hypothetical protein
MKADDFRPGLLDNDTSSPNGGRFVRDNDDCGSLPSSR